LQSLSFGFSVEGALPGTTATPGATHGTGNTVAVVIFSMRCFDQGRCQAVDDIKESPHVR
jgi:hypothetical protein